MDMRRIVGSNVRRLRRDRDMTQEVFAELSGLSQQYISGLESGLRNPTIVTLYEIASALRVHPADLLREEGA